ncbi:hypothetical protein PENSPDRAFT_48192 [Peniophora sp. CONT]|nr:hypothetical protein PENSPDRAFT_48192 [Peniophora sp. CONT]
MAIDLMGCFWKLPPQEQVVLRQGIASLYAIAATSVSGGSDGNLSEVIVTGFLRPGAVLAAFFPMAVVFVAAFAFWKRFISKTQRSIPRSPGYAHTTSIFLIDIFGNTLVLQLDMCKSWDDIHTVLLKHFSGKQVADYVRSREYQIMDSRDSKMSVIKPQDWAQTVRADMTVEMSIIVQQLSRSPQCPWCDEMTPTQDPDREMIKWCVSTRLCEIVDFIRFPA